MLGVDGGPISFAASRQLCVSPSSQIYKNHVPNDPCHRFLDSLQAKKEAVSRWKLY